MRYDVDADVLQGGNIGVGDERAEVSLAVLQGGHLRRVIGDEAEEDLVDIGGLSMPVFVSHEAGEAAGFPFFEAVGSDADRRCQIPFGFVERPVGVKDRLQDVGG